VAKGNSKHITCWNDFAQDDITMVNREEGAGSRVLLDEHLRLLGICGSSINGYENKIQSHLSLASVVGRGDADVAVGHEKIARQVVYEIIDRILSICMKAICFEDILKAVFDFYELTMDFNQYVLVGSTVRSYLSYLYDEGKLNCILAENRMLWQTIDDN